MLPEAILVGMKSTVRTAVEYGDAGIMLTDSRGLVVAFWLASDGLWSGAAFRSKLTAPVRLARIR